MNAKDRKRLRRRKRRIARRLDRNNFPKEPGPVFTASNVRYEVSDRIRATHAGGVGAAHMPAVRLGLPAATNKRLRLLKRHAPYYESDHVLNIAYNVLAGGTRLGALVVPTTTSGIPGGPLSKGQDRLAGPLRQARPELGEGGKVVGEGFSYTGVAE